MKKYIFFIILIIFNYTFFSLSFTEQSFESTNPIFIYPTIYTNISSEYGYRTLYGNNNFHTGVDFLAPQGSEIYATSSGYITYASFLKDGYGNTVIIEHENNIKSLYCHMSENFIVNVGDYVNSGDLIGYVGPKYLSSGILNGNTTGPHLHFSIFVNNKTVNPLEYVKK